MEQSIESLFFRTQKISKSKSLSAEVDDLAEQIVFYNAADRRLNLGDNELARQTLTSNEIDFSRKDVQVKTASPREGSRDQKVLEIDLGPVQSLEKNTQRREALHAELNDGILKDSEVTDQFTSRGSQYKLVLVGREISPQEERQFQAQG